MRSVAFCALLVLAGGATAGSHTLDLGQRGLDIPDPAGHVPTSMYYPEIVRAYKSLAPANMEIEEVYVTRADFEKLQAQAEPGLESTLQLQMLAGTRGRLLSTEGYDEFAGAIAGALGRATPAGVTLLKAPAKEPGALYYTIGVGQPEGGRPYDTVVASTDVVVNHQLLHLVHTVAAKAPDAQARSESGVREWSAAVRAANPSRAGLDADSGPLDLSALGLQATGSGGGGDGPARFGYWLGIAAFVFIVYRFFRRRAA
jgi:hypothetical protein